MKSGYEAFVEKFKTKKTTDDCYTPPAVYAAVLDYVKTIAPLDGVEVVRPFYPGGDFESHEYPAGCVVVDNPPFSILAKIVRFYTARGVKFFLFAPTLTLWSTKIQEVTYVVTDIDVTYENGAKINTSFITNLIPSTLAMTCPKLRKAIKDAQKSDKPQLPKYRYPDNVVTATRLGAIADLDVAIPAGRFISRLESQRATGKAVFGSGILVSDTVARELREREREWEREREREREREQEQGIVWGLSQEERNIIEELNIQELL